METIDLTPTWAAVLPILLAAMENGTDEGRRLAREEFARMAQAADKYNQVTSRALKALAKTFPYADKAVSQELADGGVGMREDLDAIEDARDVLAKFGP